MASLSRYKTLASHLYLIQFVLRHIALIVAESQYVRLRKQFKDSPSPELEQKIAMVQEWMVSIGSTQRSLGGIAIYGYGFFLTIPLLAYMTRLPSIREALSFEQNDFYLYITKPQVSQANIANRLESYLHELICSNIHFKQKDAILKFYHRNRPSLESLATQSHYLNSLRNNLNLLWPPNRERDGTWRKRLEKPGTFIYSLVCLIYWVPLMTSLVISTRMAYKLEGRFYIMDRLNCVEQCFLTYLIVPWLAHLGSTFLLNMVDQLAYLRHLNKRFADLLNQLASPVEWVSLDREALQLYIQLRLFPYQLQGCLRIANLLAGQFVLLNLSMLFTYMGFIKCMTRDELRVCGLMSLVEVSIINMMLIVASAFNAKCLRIYKLVWSLVALSAVNHKAGTISSHTQMLWRKLLGDQTQLIDRHSCKLFNVIRINYTFVLKLNFWLISLIIFVVSTEFV